MASRFFTPEQANEALAEVRPLTAQLVEHRRGLVAAHERRSGLARQVAGNGGGLDPRELAAATADLEREAAGIARCVAAIEELGAVVKDLDEGLVDFPARRDDEEILLCWRLGEQEVAHWHGLEEGFAGRKPL